VLGIGKGTVAVIAFGIIGLVVCFFKDMTTVPSMMVFIGVALPLLVLLILWFCPKQSLQNDTQQEQKLPTDPFRVRTGVFSGLIFLVCLFTCLLMCGARLTTQLVGQKVDSELYNLKARKSQA
jgi:hypothetical protein